jgi:hypothetical protein
VLQASPASVQGQLSCAARLVVPSITADTANTNTNSLPPGMRRIDVTLRNVGDTDLQYDTSYANFPGDDVLSTPAS